MVYRQGLRRDGQSDDGGNRSVPRFKLASALTFTVIN